MARSLHAQGLPGEEEGWSFPTPLNSWTFGDTNTWTSDYGHAPISFTNLASSSMGDLGGYSLWLDSANPAWLNYKVREDDGATNLTGASGSLVFWFAPGNWASATTNQNGSGPGDWARLIEVGAYTTNASHGWWSLYLDSGGTNLYFAAQTNSGDGATVIYLSAPIDWESNIWHNLALTYSPTNSALYLDGQLAASGAGVSVFPGPEVWTNGFWIGSESSSGLAQVRGMFDDIYAYGSPLDASTVASIYSYLAGNFAINIFNTQSRIAAAPSSPSTSPVFNAITGPGWLQWAGSASGCVTDGNVWLTNVTAVLAGAGTNVTTACTFTIAGGANGAVYDVFATGALAPTDSAYGWAWLGQGNTCNLYTMTNLPAAGAFLILGQPTDSDNDGLTTAYENLVSKTDPLNPDTNGDGLLDGWEVYWGMNALQNNPGQASLRRNYGYDLSGWLHQLTGVNAESIGLDDEGNIQSAQ